MKNRKAGHELAVGDLVDVWPRPDVITNLEPRGIHPSVGEECWTAYFRVELPMTIFKTDYFTILNSINHGKQEEQQT